MSEGAENLCILSSHTGKITWTFGDDSFRTETYPLICQSTALNYLSVSTQTMICTLPCRPSSQQHLPMGFWTSGNGSCTGPGDRNPSKVLGSMGHLLRKRDPIDVALRSTGSFSHQLCSSQNELSAHRKSDFQVTGLGTKSSSVFSSQSWITK